MAAPAQSDWTTEVSWTDQCKGVDWSRHPYPTEEEKAVAGHQPLGHSPAHMKYPAFRGIQFIDVEEKKSQERQQAKEEQQASGDIPSRYEHNQRHKSHKARFEHGQHKRQHFMKELTVHLICRPDESIHIANELQQICERNNMLQLNDGKDPKEQTEEVNFNISHSENAVTFCGGIHELKQFFLALSKLSLAKRSKIRCESSDFTLLAEFPGTLKPLNGANVEFFSDEKEYEFPSAPQRRVEYNRSSLCRISEPMKLIDADYGRSDTVWIRVLSNNDELARGCNKRRTKDELVREAGVWTSPHHPTKVHVPPAKANVVEMGRGASTSSTMSFLPSPPRKSKPSGDIKHYLFKSAIKWSNEAEQRKIEEKIIQRDIEQYLRRNATSTKKKTETPSSMKAAFERKQLKDKNQRNRKQAIALRKWREARIQDLKLVVGGIDLSNVPNTVLARCRQITQYGVKRVYNRHLRKRPVSAKLPTLLNTLGSDESEVKALEDDVLLEEFNRKMRLVLFNPEDSEIDAVLDEPVDPVTKESLLHVACKLERVVHVKVLLALLKVDINRIEITRKRTPLHIASEIGNAEIVGLFLEKRLTDLDINCVDDRNWTPLHIAAHAGHTEVVQLLLPYSGNNGHLETFDTGDSPLHLASAAGRNETIVEMLSFYHETYFQKNFATQPKILPPITPLTTPPRTLSNKNSETNENKIIRHPESNGTDGTDENKQEPPIQIIENIVIDVLRLTNHQGCTPLHMAAANGYLNVVKQLESAPSPVPKGGYRLVMIRDEEGNLPVMHSVIGGQNECALFLWKELISKKFRRVPKGDALRVFELAVRGNNDILVQHFCQDIKGIENATGVEEEKEGWSLVHLAAHLGFDKVIAAMAAVGNADMNLEDNESMRPLDLACMAGHRLASTVLLDAGGVMGKDTMSKRAKKLWKKAMTTVTGSIRNGVMEQERLIKKVDHCEKELIKAIATRNAVAIIDATDEYQEAKLALKQYREYFLMET